VAVIGDEWVDVPGDDGQPRLRDPDDLLRREIAIALLIGVKVVPVLVANASMPRVSDLPDDLKALAGLNAIEVRPSSFSADADRLVNELEKMVAPPPQPKQKPANTRGLVIVALIALFGTLGGLLIANWDNIFDSDETTGANTASGSDNDETSGGNTPPASPGAEVLSDCFLGVDAFFAKIHKEPNFASRELGAVPDGSHQGLEFTESEFAGKTFGWFLIDVEGESGWIVDDGFQIESKTSGCP
jgi:hypothetical protein